MPASDISIASISIACENIQSAARSTLLFVSFSAFVACVMLKPIATIISKPAGSGTKDCGLVSVPKRKHSHEVSEKCCPDAVLLNGKFTWLH